LRDVLDPQKSDNYPFPTPPVTHKLDDGKEKQFTSSNPLDGAVGQNENSADMPAVNVSYYWKLQCFRKIPHYWSLCISGSRQSAFLESFSITKKCGIVYP